MAVEIRWFHHASFRITDGKTVVYIDPWKIPNQPHDADVVFISHSHFDHCSLPDIGKISKPDTAVIAPADTVGKLPGVTPVTPGQTLGIKNISLKTVPAYNIGKSFHPRVNNWCGAVFTFGPAAAPVKIYYAGDTDLTPEMAELNDIDLALLPVGGTYTMDGPTAAKACDAIGCKAVLPYHWGDIVGSHSDALQLSHSAPCKVHILKPDQAVTI